MSDIQQEQLKKKFELAYFVAKELPFIMYKDLVKLEKHHGVDIGDTYMNCIECAEFIDFQGEHLATQLAKYLTILRFYSVLVDGTTECSNTEKELVYVLYFDRKHSGENIALKDVKKSRCSRHLVSY